MPQTKPNMYYRDRAIVRKIIREGTGLDVTRTSDEDLWNIASRHMGMALAFFEQLDSSNVPLARALWELEEIISELAVRGVQLRFVFESDNPYGLGRYNSPDVAATGDGPPTDPQ